MDSNQTSSFFNHRMVTSTPKSYCLNSQKISEWGWLHIQCHARKNDDDDENHQSRARFFPRPVSQPFLKVRFPPGHLQRSYQTRKVPTICSYIWNRTPLIYSTWVLHWASRFCSGERAAVPLDPRDNMGSWHSRGDHPAPAPPGPARGQRCLGCGYSRQLEPQVTEQSLWDAEHQ